MFCYVLFSDYKTPFITLALGLQHIYYQHLLLLADIVYQKGVLQFSRCLLVDSMPWIIHFAVALNILYIKK